MALREVQLIEVAAPDDGVRLDRWLRRRWPEIGQTQVHRLARSGQLRVDGGRVKAETRLAVGSVVRVPPLSGAATSTEREALSTQDKAFAKSLVLYEDDDILVLNKPAGLSVQGGTKTHRHIDRLLSAWGEGQNRPRLVHRLDRDTSGVLAVGKSASAAAFLARAFAGREVEKTYWAIVWGAPNPAQGRIDLSLAKVGVDDRERMVTVEPGDPAGKPSVSDYRTLAAQEEASWMALRPLTGRTHQLRAHMLALNHPILGDPKYHTTESHAASGDLKLQLHARRLFVPRPGGRVLTVVAPVGRELALGLQRFGFDSMLGDLDAFDT